LWLRETADLDRRAGRTGYPEVAHAHVGALRERLIVRDEGVGLDDIGPGRAGSREAGVKVLEGLFELRPHVARADDVALLVARQLAGDVDRLARACDRDDVRIGGFALLNADVHARRLDPVDLHGDAVLPSQIWRPGWRGDRDYTAPAAIAECRQRHRRLKRPKKCGLNQIRPPMLQGEIGACGFDWLPGRLKDHVPRKLSCYSRFGRVPFRRRAVRWRQCE